MKKQLRKTIVYTHPKTGKKFLIFITVFGLLMTGCGASIGNSAWGTTGFMIEHNRKVGLLQTAFTPSDRAMTNRAWEK